MLIFSLNNDLIETYWNINFEVAFIFPFKSVDSWTNLTQSSKINISIIYKIREVAIWT